MSRPIGGTWPLALLACAFCAARAGEPPKAAGASEEEKARLLAAETAEQKKLRVELAAIKGQRIVYNSNFEDGVQRLYLVNPDGSDFKRLTPKDWKGDQEYPHVSPDGKKVAFGTKRKMTREELAKLPCDPDYRLGTPKRFPPKATLWTMNPDGSDARPVVMGGAPHWSPNGRYLSYCSDVRPNTRRFGLYDVEKRTEHLFDVGKQPGTTCFSAEGRYYVFGSFYLKIEEIIAGAEKPKPVKHGGRGCNQEVTPDNKWIVHVTDYKDGSWICRLPFEPGKRGKSQGLELGWPKATQNYFPEVSPDCRYMAYGHWESWDRSKRSGRYETNAADLYVTRWPPDGVNVRVSWHGGTTQNPHWHAAGE